MLYDPQQVLQQNLADEENDDGLGRKQVDSSPSRFVIPSHHHPGGRNSADQEIFALEPRGDDVDDAFGLEQDEASRSSGMATPSPPSIESDSSVDSPVAAGAAEALAARPGVTEGDAPSSVDERWQALLDEEDDEEEAIGKDDQDYCPPEAEEEEDMDAADLDFEAEREAMREDGASAEDDALDGDLALDDDDEASSKKTKKKSGKGGGGGGKKRPAALLNDEEIAAASLSGYSTSSLAEEIFSVTIKKKMGGPIAGDPYVVANKKRKKASGGGGSTSYKKKSSQGGGNNKRKKNASSEDDDDDFEVSASGSSYGTSTSTKRKGTKRLLPDIMYRSLTAIPMTSVPLIFARVLKTLPPSDYDIYEIQNLIVTFALDDATYGSGSTAAAAAAAAAVDTNEANAVQSGDGIVQSSCSTTNEGTVGVTGESTVETTTTTPSCRETSSADDGSAPTVPAPVPAPASVPAPPPPSAPTPPSAPVAPSSAEEETNEYGFTPAEERIYQDVMRLVKTDKKYLHQHVPIGHSSFSHVQTDAAMLKKYEAFLNSPEQRSKRHDFLCEGSRHGWTEDELERYEQALQRSRGNVRQTAQRLGVEIERVQYFVFLYKRMLNSQAVEAAGVAAAIAAAADG